MGTLVVGFDGTDCSLQALRTATDLAKGLGDSVVIVFGYEPGSYGEEHSAHRDAVREVAEGITARGLELAKAAGVEAEVELVPERPVDALISVGERHGARAIVVGSYGEAPLKGAILGSTPHKLLQLSPLPVICVPMPEDSEEAKQAPH